MTSSLLCFSLLLLAGSVLAATPTCKKINDCACTPTDASATGVINFYPLMNSADAKPFYMVNGTSQQTKDNYTFYFNPCVGFTLSSKNMDNLCTKDLLCQTAYKYNYTYNIGAANSTEFAYVNNVLFAYYYSKSAVNRTTEVRLICDENETHGKLVYIAEPKMLYYQFNFTSMCACPGKCPNKTLNVLPDKWVEMDSCSYKQARSGAVVSLHGLETPLKIAVDDDIAYYYSPCSELDLGILDKQCKDMAICKQDTSTSRPSYEAIGGRDPEVSEDDGDIVLHYPAPNGGIEIKLICDQAAMEPVFTSIGKDRVLLKTKFACPK